MMALGIRSWSRPHCARWGPSSPPQKSGQSPQFSAHFYCDQTAGCVKMPLRIEVSLSPGNFVLDGDPAPPPKGTEPPIFGPRLLWPNRCIDQDATWYGGRPRPTRHCVRCGPSFPSPKGTQPQFSANVCCGQTQDGLRCHLVWTRRAVFYCGHVRISQLLLSSCFHFWATVCTRAQQWLRWATLAKIDMGQKRGLLCPFRGKLGPVY